MKKTKLNFTKLGGFSDFPILSFVCPVELPQVRMELDVQGPLNF